MAVLDSGNRREFSTGAVRDMNADKGRCDLVPLDVVYEYFSSLDRPDSIFMLIEEYKKTGKPSFLIKVLEEAIARKMFANSETMFLEVSRQFQDGCEKYGENNWQKGISTKWYIDSATRHYFKYRRFDNDERHDRAFVWNIVCALWTCFNKPELNVYVVKEE